MGSVSPEQLDLVTTLIRDGYDKEAILASDIISRHVSMNAICEWQTGYKDGERKLMDRMHPLTCGNDSSHAPLFPVFADGRMLLVCADCDYVQKHIPVAVQVAGLDPNVLFKQ